VNRNNEHGLSLHILLFTQELVMFWTEFHSTVPLTRGHLKLQLAVGTVEFNHLLGT